MTENYSKFLILFLDRFTKKCPEIRFLIENTAFQALNLGFTKPTQLKH